MQDSLDDYIKLASNVNDKDIKSQLSPEVLSDVLTTAEHRKKCENYAQKIVEFLIDGKLRPQSFARSLNFINAALYDDVVEERAISKLCGYPLCGKKIPDMPSKKYVILAKVNKVYDITDRKNYCSNFCYKASSHIKKQIDESPLWLRQTENYQEYNLLEKTSNGLTPGEEIVYGNSNSPTEDTFTSVSAFTEACLDEAEGMEKWPEFDNDAEDYEVKFEPNCNAQISKSILKKDELKVENNSKKVSFIDDDIEMKTPQEELHKSIQSLCSSLNIKLDLTKDDKKSDLVVRHREKRYVETKENEIQIDVDKMNKVIAKVNESEAQRKKPILMDTTVNPEIHIKNTNVFSTSDSNKELEPPKYSQRLNDMVNTVKPVKSNVDLPEIIEKVKSLQMNRSKRKSTSTLTRPHANDDDKMKEILEKLRHKNTNQKRTILIDTVQNPELLPLRTNLEENVKKFKHTTPPTSKLTVCELNAIKSAFLRWLTIESYMFLHGEDVIKKTLSEDKLGKYFETLNVTKLETSQQLKYLAICKKLQMKEVADKKFDSACFGQANELKPLPDYSQLKQQAKGIDLKVKGFYTGGTYDKSNVEKLAETAMETNEDTNAKDEDHLAILPLVDAASQGAMRRNIFNRSITKFTLNHVSELRLDESVTSKVQCLIKTFKLEANNIVFKPGQWNIIALILINCLRKCDSTLNTTLDTEDSRTYIKNCIQQFPNADSFLDDINQVLHDVDGFVVNYIERHDL